MAEVPRNKNKTKSPSVMRHHFVEHDLFETKFYDQHLAP